MVALLALAHERNCEAALAVALEAILEAGALPDPAELERRFAPASTAMPAVTVTLPVLDAYDSLYAA